MTAQGAETWRGYRRGDKTYRNILLALFAAGIVTFAQLYSTQAVLPVIHADHQLGVSESQAALTVSAATLGLVIAVLPWASVADYIGRVRAMKLSVVSAVLVGLVTPLSPTFELFLGLRFVEGVLLGALPAVAMAYIAEEVYYTDVPVAAGTFVSGSSIGGLSGRLISGPVAEFTSWRVGVLAVGLWALVFAVVFLVTAPKPRGFISLRDRRALQLNTVQVRFGAKMAAVLKDPSLVSLYVTGFVLMGTFVAVYNFIGFHLLQPPFNLSPTVVSLLFLVYLSGTYASGAAGRLAERMGRAKTLALALTMMVLGVFLTIPEQLWIIFVGLFLITMGFFGGHAVASSWVGTRATVGKAQASALYTLFYYAGSSVMGWSQGLVFQAFGWSATAVAIVSVLICGAIVCAFGLLWGSKTSPRHYDK